MVALMPQLRQQVLLSELEACALWAGLRLHLHQVQQQLPLSPLPAAEALQLRPLSQLTQRLQRLAQGRWPAARPGRGPRPRALRLEYDEVLSLLLVHARGQLQPLLSAQHGALLTAVGKVHQQGLNLGGCFRL